MHLSLAIIFPSSKATAVSLMIPDETRRHFLHPRHQKTFRHAPVIEEVLHLFSVALYDNASLLFYNRKYYLNLRSIIRSNLFSLMPDKKAVPSRFLNVFIDAIVFTGSSKKYTPLS